MLLAAAQKMGAGLSKAGLAGCGLGVGIVFAGFLISICFNPMESAYCEALIGSDVFDVEIAKSPTKPLPPVKEEAISKLPKPNEHDFLDYALICVGTTASIALAVIVYLQIFK
jgi:hypothetical protein